MSTSSIARSVARVLAQRFGVGVVLIAGIVGLSRVAFQSTRPAQETLPVDPPGSGIVVHAEVTTIWLPQGLFDLAQRKTDQGGFASHEETRSQLDRLWLGTAWYAMTYRGRQINGKVGEITFICWPGELPEQLKEYQDVMATAAGRPPDHPGVDFSRAKVVVFSDSLLNADPREVVTELTTQSCRSR